MRVIFLAPGLARVKRGYERFVLELSAELRRGGFDATCWGTSEAEGVEAISLPGREELRAFALERLNDDARFSSLSPTALQDWAVHAEDQLFAIPAAARIEQLLAQGEPLLVYAKWQGGLVDSSGAPTQLLKLLATASAQGKASLVIHTDYIHAPIDSLVWRAGGNFHSLGPWITGQLVQMGVERNGILEFPMCVEATAYNNCRQFRAQMRSELGIPAGAFVILSVGSFDTTTPDKRHAHLLHEIESLPEAQNVWWAVAGSRGPAPTTWEQKAREVLGPRFVPLANVPFERMPKLYGMADLFALASMEETFGLVYLEAQIAGLPAVIHDSAISRHLCSGLSPELRRISLVDMRREGAAANAIRRWISLLRKRTDDIPAQGALREFADEQEHRFGWASVGPQYAVAFQHLAASPPGKNATARRDFGTWDEQTHRQGLRLFEDGNHRDALLLFGRSLGGRETSERWNDWATAQLALKNPAEAEQGFRRAMALDPRSAQAAANLGVLLAASGRSAEAIPLLVQGCAGVDLGQQTKIAEILADCRAKQIAAALPEDAEISRELRLLAGTDFEDELRFRERLPFCLAVLKAIPQASTGHKLLGIGPDVLFLATALARWKGYKDISWRSISTDSRRKGMTATVAGNALALRADEFDIEQEWPYGDASFNVVLIDETIESLCRDPMQGLSEANRVLKSGGLLLLTAPNLASAQAVHAVLHGKSPYVDGRFPQDAESEATRHNREYTPAEMERVAKAAGFEVVQLHTHDRYWDAPDKIFPALAASGYPVGMRGDTILLLARKETPVRDRYPTLLYDLTPAPSVKPASGASAAIASPHTRSLLAPADGRHRPLRVLAVHENLPRPDQSGAEYRFLQTLRELRAQGHSVTYLAARGFEEERYAPALTELGIEIYTNDAQVLRREGVEAVPKWTLQELLHEGQFDAALFYLWFWMSISIPENYLDELRRFSPRTRIIVLTDDCHGLRELRGANLSRAWSDRERAQDYREREAQILRSADIVLAVSNDDRQRLLEDSPQLEIGLLPNVVEAGPAGPDFDAREGLMYLADYNNPASCDGIEWYQQQVAPLVRKSLPDVSVHLVGAGLRPNFLTGSEGLVRVGFVPQLSSELDKHVMLIAPVRYGTGTKTKILHALAHGVPIVTTKMGGEGIDLRDGETALIADTSEDFAKAVVRLHSDRDLWRTLSARGRAHILEKFPHQRMASLLRETLNRARDAQPKSYDPAHAWSVRLVEQYFPEVLTHYPPQERIALRILAYARAAEQLAAVGNRDEAWRQLRHIFSYVPNRIPLETLFGELSSIAEIMERTYRALGETEGAADFRRQARSYAPGVFPEATIATTSTPPQTAAAPQSAKRGRVTSRTGSTHIRGSHKLDFSVIIPTYNRCETLAACLHALGNQSFSPRRYEAIVVDDGSSDGTEEFCRGYRARFEFHYVRQANGGAGAARQLGVAHSRGQFLLLFNDDSIADRALLSQHWRAHRDSPGRKMAVLGDFRYPESARHRALTHFLSIEPFLFPQATLAPGDHSKNAYFIASNLSVRRDAVLAAGSFDPRFRMAEDTELGVRLRQAGFHVRYIPQARAIHDHATITFADLIRRAELYGRTELLLLRKHPHLLGDGTGPFGRLESAAIEKLRAYVAERESEVKDASRSLEKFDSIDFAPFFSRPSGARTAADDVMEAFKVAVPAVFWFHIVSGFLSAWDEQPDHPGTATPEAQQQQEVRVG